MIKKMNKDSGEIMKYLIGAAVVSGQTEEHEKHLSDDFANTELIEFIIATKHYEAFETASQ